MTPKISELQDKLSSLGDSRTKETVDTLNELAWEVGFSDVYRTAELAERATEIARELSYDHGIAWGLLNQAYRDYFVAEYDVALSKAHEAATIFEATGERYGTANVLVGLGLVYWSLGDFERAVETLHEGIEIVRDLGAEDREAWGLTSLGGVYESIGDLEKSVRCQKDALALFQKKGNRVGEGRALTGLGAVLQRQGRLDEALRHYQASLSLAREGGNSIAESRALNDIGTVHRDRGELAEAEAALRGALELRRASGNRPAEITSLLDLGVLFTDQGNYGEARSALKEALLLATTAKTKPKIYRAHEALSRVCELSGDYEDALHHHREFQRLKEEVLGEESATRLKNLQIKLEAEAVEQLKQAQARLVQSENMAALGKLVAGIAHEFNSPLGAIRSSADVAARALRKLDASLPESSKEDQRTTLETLEAQHRTVASAGERLERIVTSLKRFIRLDEAEFQLADVHEGIQATLELLEAGWGERIRIVRRFGDLPRIEAYPSELNQALMTLLMNAGEAIETEGTVTITTERDTGWIRILIDDSGRGIPQERLSSLFDVGFVRRGSRVSLRVGLANVRATIDHHNGEIEVRSELDKGTTVSIRLPVRQRPAHHPGQGQENLLA